ncbi:type I-F CRISPR-associated protein Csy3, partial [Vibrio rotiferianus]
NLNKAIINMAKKPAAKPTLLSSTIFSLNKRILPSAGTFYGSTWEDRHTNVVPLTIEEKTVRGTMSHHIKAAVASDPLKLQREIEKANIQSIDDCSLSPTQDTLIVKFSVNFLPCKDGLEACNNPEYASKYLGFIDTFSQDIGFDVLAERYAYNLASGRMLWKNRIGAEKVEVTITHKEFESEDVSTWVFDGYTMGSINEPNANISEFAQTIAKALSGESPYALFNITVAAKRGLSQVVFPSQEFIQNKTDNKEAKKKVLYSTGGIAGLHDQKIGNAIRTIDTWYPEFNEFLRPISVEVYGAVTNLSKALRPPTSGTDYHSLMKKMIQGEALSDNERHYIAAMFIRGGVLGTEK